MLDNNSTPRTVRSLGLGQEPEAFVSNGSNAVRLSIPVSHRKGKDQNGQNVYETEWIQAVAYDNQYEKLATIIQRDYHKGTPVLAVLRHGTRKEDNIFYKDSNGNIQPFKNGFDRQTYTVLDIGILAYDKSGNGTHQGQPQQGDPWAAQQGGYAAPQAQGQPQQGYAQGAPAPQGQPQQGGYVAPQGQPQQGGYVAPQASDSF